MNLFESRTNTFEKFFAMRDKVIPKHTAHKEKSPEQIKKAHMKTTIPMFADNVTRYKWVYKQLPLAKDCFLQPSYSKTKSGKTSWLNGTNQLMTADQSLTNTSTSLLRAAKSQEHLLGWLGRKETKAQVDFVDEGRSVLKPSTAIAFKRPGINRSHMNFMKAELGKSVDGEEPGLDCSKSGLLANSRSSPTLVGLSSPQGSRKKLNCILQGLPEVPTSDLPRVRSPARPDLSLTQGSLVAADRTGSHLRVRLGSPKWTTVCKKMEAYPHVC